MANILQRAAKMVRARIGLDDYATVLQHSNLYGPTQAGVNITSTTALTISAVYACVYKIAGTLAQLNLDLIHEQGRSMERVRNHPAYYVTQVSPNIYCTPFDFWETIISHAVLRGAGHALIERGTGGTVQSLTVLDPDDVERREMNGAYVYRVRNEFTVQPDDMLEIFNLYKASPIMVHRDNLGLSKAVQDYGAQYFSNGGQMTGVLSSDTPLRAEQMEVIQKSWNRSATTSGTKLLPFGFKYSRVSITPDEAQFINTRRLQAEEVCRIFSVPPSLIQLETQSTFNNVEQQSIQFTRHTLGPWAKRIEQELNRKLLNTFEQSEHQFRFRMADLHRGDMAARAAFYQQAISSGWMTINEVRMNEQMNPITGGDIATVQVNQVSLEHFDQYSKTISEPTTQSNEGRTTATDSEG
jgi:HK97 family phage portal protein